MKKTEYFDKLNDAFRQVYIEISHSNPITDQCDYEHIDSAITSYMQLYRTQLSSKVTPKHHILEHHCLPFIRKYKFGLGLHSEHGLEQSHSSIRGAEVAARHIRSKSEKIKYILRRHNIMTCPVILARKPVKRKRTKSAKKQLFQ